MLRFEIYFIYSDITPSGLEVNNNAVATAPSRQDNGENGCRGYSIIARVFNLWSADPQGASKGSAGKPRKVKALHISTKQKIPAIPML